MYGNGSVLLALARAQLNGTSASDIAGSIASAPDPLALLEAARAHALLAVLMSRGGDSIPEPARTSGKRMLQRLEFRQLESVRLLRQLKSGFENYGVRPIPFKGPSLSTLLYGDPIARQSTDIDLLVLPEDVDASADVLVSNGFAPAHGELGHVRTLLTYTNELTFVRESDGLLVEVQWSVAPPYFSIPFDMRPLWDRVSTVDIGGTEFLSLGQEDLLLLLLIHGAKHLWERLGWICDIAALIQRGPSLDYESVMQRARAARATRSVLVGMFLGAQLARTTLPSSCIPAQEADPKAERVARTLWRRTLSRDPDLTDPPFRRLDMALRETIQDKVSYCWLLATTPTTADLEASGYRDRSKIAYLPARFVRLAKKYRRVGAITS